MGHVGTQNEGGEGGDMGTRGACREPVWGQIFLPARRRSPPEMECKWGALSWWEKGECKWGVGTRGTAQLSTSQSFGAERAVQTRNKGGRQVAPWPGPHPLGWLSPSPSPQPRRTLDSPAVEVEDTEAQRGVPLHRSAGLGRVAPGRGGGPAGSSLGVTAPREPGKPCCGGGGAEAKAAREEQTGCPASSTPSPPLGLS